MCVCVCASLPGGVYLIDEHRLRRFRYCRIVVSLALDEERAVVCSSVVGRARAVSIRPRESRDGGSAREINTNPRESISSAGLDNLFLISSLARDTYTPISARPPFPSLLSPSLVSIVRPLYPSSRFFIFFVWVHDTFVRCSAPRVSRART